MASLLLASLGGTRGVCPAELQCSEWAHTYFGDCVCSLRDGVSFGLGLVSLVSWAVAEVPQIMTNFFVGSTEGVSLAFLMTWTFGDIFNLAGCYLEPATLPTQYYTALMYTITTVVLVAQSFYYEVLHPKAEEEAEEQAEEAESLEAPLLGQQHAFGSVTSLPVEPPAAEPSQVIHVPLQRRSSTRNIHIHSARSLASSHTPTMGSYVPGSSNPHRSSYHHNHHVGSLLSQSPGQGVPHVSLRNSPPVTTTMAFGVSLVSCLVISCATWHFASTPDMPLPTFLTSTHSPSPSLPITPAFNSSHQSRALIVTSLPSPLPLSHRHYRSRGNTNFKALREGGDGSAAGQVLGWLMAAIYMGGRIPQIWLNIQRGSVEGLSPLMFLFALVGNAAYVGSILVRNMEWSVIAPNLAWLVDAAVCVLLDLFILCQFVYYTFKNAPEEEVEEPPFDEFK